MPSRRPRPDAANREVAVAPIECWWKTDRSAVRVGEQFQLTLTCAVLDTEKVKVVVDESSLAPSALHLVPFEIVERPALPRHHERPRRFFQYQYTMRVLGEEFFGKEISLPRLQLSYRVQNSLNGGSALAGREEQYSLRPVPMRVLSLVPRGADRHSRHAAGHVRRRRRAAVPLERAVDRRGRGTGAGWRSSRSCCSRAQP